ncbi:MAG: hypothetical protein ACR2M1_11560 [Gemmatimonadaceae bacterium]
MAQHIPPPLSVHFSPSVTLFSLVLLILTAACGGGDGGVGPNPPPPPPPPPSQLALTSARNFAAGDTALISGTKLGSLASITIDGQSVPFSAVGDTLVRVPVPVSIGHACDVDGRLVEVKAVANSGGAAATNSFPIAVGATQNLSIGQSVVLAAVDLQCLKLPAGGAAYVLSALDLARGDPVTLASTFDTLGTLTVTDGGGAITASSGSARRVWRPGMRMSRDLSRERCASLRLQRRWTDLPRFGSPGLGGWHCALEAQY